jgi:CRISPR-associated protein Cmr4
MLAETAVHVGTGRTAGVVDLPVAREGPTDYPYAPGSGMKGALRDHARHAGMNTVDQIFGTTDHAGDLLPGDARLVLLPVRVLDGSYLWLSCPYLLERLTRDLRRLGIDSDLEEIQPQLEHVIVAKNRGSNSTYLEDQRFQTDVQEIPSTIATLGRLIGHEQTRNRIGPQIGIVSDADFSWFVRNALPVNARNQLDPDSKRSENLWYEETLPTDTLMYSVVVGRNGATDPASTMQSLFGENPYLQVGGNETVGHGWFQVTVVTAEGGDQ